MQPYSIDLRRRIVEAYLNKEGSQRQLAQRFSVSLGTVRNYLQLYRQTGHLAPRPRSGGRAPKIKAEDLPLLRQVLEESPDATLAELGQSLEQRAGIKAGTTSIWRAIEKLGWTRKKNAARQ